MTVSAKKKSKSATKSGRSHQALKRIKLIKRGNELVRPHYVSSTTGTYRGRQVLKIKTKKKKEIKK